MKCLRSIGEFFLAMAMFVLLLLILKQWQDDDEEGGVFADWGGDGAVGSETFADALVVKPLQTKPGCENITYRR